MLVLVSPYSWLPEYTEPSRWLGGQPCRCWTPSLLHLLQRLVIAQLAGQNALGIGGNVGHRQSAKLLLTGDELSFLSWVAS